MKILTRRRALAAVAAVGLAAGAVAATTAVTGASAQQARARILKADGTHVGFAHFSAAEDGVVVKAALDEMGPGFHGFHVHMTGVCDPTATDSAGNPSPFFTAGGHYNPSGAVHRGHSGDMPPLLVTESGKARAKFLTDRFTIDELLEGDGSAVIVHAAPDNLAHIPATTATGAERYHSHVDNVYGPDAATRATGDAGGRSACGVIEAR